MGRTLYPAAFHFAWAAAIPMQSMELAGTGVTKHNNLTLCYTGRLIPTRFLIGVQKCGTSSIFRDLAGVPGMHRPSALKGEPGFYQKEQHFFNHDERFQKGMGFYASHYPPCPSHRDALALDGTPDYSRRPDVAMRIYHAYGPHHAELLRFVFVVRDPATRLRSYYDHFRDRMDPTLATSFTAFATHALQQTVECAARRKVPLHDGDLLWATQENESLCRTRFGVQPVLGSLFAPQLRNWLRWFAASQVAVSCLNGYRTEPAQVWADLERFLLARATRGPLKSQSAPLGTPAATPATQTNTARIKSSVDPFTAQQLDAFFKPHRQDFLQLVRKRSRQDEKSPVPERQRLFVTPARFLGMEESTWFGL